MKRLKAWACKPWVSDNFTRVMTWLTYLGIWVTITFEAIAGNTFAIVTTTPFGACLVVARAEGKVRLSAADGGLRLPTCR